MDNQLFIQSLSKHLAPNQIRTAAEDIRDYTRDYRQLFDHEALAVCWPEKVEDVQHIVKVCSEYNVAVVPQGGNTSYAGGANPVANIPQLIVSLSLMNNIDAIDPINRSVLVEAGATLESVQEAAKNAGLYFPLDLGARGSAQIGGLISTNAGGINVVKYGNMRDSILGIEVVNANAEVLHNLSPLRKNNTGYNLSHLHAGAEGTLGIITKAQLKLVSEPLHRLTALFAYDTFDDVIAAFGYLMQHAGDSLHSFEYISKPTVELANASGVCPRFAIDSDAPHYILAELTSGETDNFNDSMTELLGAMMEKTHSVDGVIAQSSQQSAALWQFRESIPHAERHFGGSVKFDIAVPISKMGSFIKQGLAISQEITGPHRPSYYGHIGDGNVHFNILAPEGVSFTDFRQQYEAQLSTALFDLAARLDGSFSAEHGIGQLKRNEVIRYKDPATIETYRHIKAALDKNSLFNPGKLIP